ncbi:hypothetical protein [Methylobacterium nigriterrae]|uniref:hypothetical protein n=1 Tax=Methylobacterium nigriterrae TaxID=3127512 RepID=UPI0030141CCB
MTDQNPARDAFDEIDELRREHAKLHARANIYENAFSKLAARFVNGEPEASEIVEAYLSELSADVNSGIQGFSGPNAEYEASLHLGYLEVLKMQLRFQANSAFIPAHAGPTAAN